MNDLTAPLLIENGGGNEETIYGIIEHNHGWSLYFDDQEKNERHYHMRQRLYRILLEDKQLDCSKFYNEKGTKITKELKSILADIGVTKEEFTKFWAQDCAAIGDLYIQVKAKARMLPKYFETAKMGIFGDSDSCFQQGGCNQFNGVFIDVSPACGVLTVTPEPPGADLTESQRRARYGRARMICYVEDAHTAWLINIYHQYSRREVPKNIMVRALEELSGAKIKYQRTSSDETLPIFINHPPMRCEAIEGNFDKLTTDYRWGCPICSKKFEPTQVVTDLENNTYMVGCSSRCCNEQAEFERYECYNCGCGVHEDEVRFVEGDAYCPDCYWSNYFFCECCNSDVDKDDAVEIRGYRFDDKICSSCAEHHGVECQHCDELWYQGEEICPDCIDQYAKCTECDEYVLTEDATYDKHGRPFCEECWDDEEYEEATG